MEKKYYMCCLCGHAFTGYGNDPWPVVKDATAQCCNECNAYVVIPARIRMAREQDGTEQSK